jgi:hypothetical protein
MTPLVDAILTIIFGLGILGGLIYSVFRAINHDRVAFVETKQKRKFMEYKDLPDLRLVHHRSINQEIWG